MHTSQQTHPQTRLFAPVNEALQNWIYHMKAAAGLATLDGNSGAAAQVTAYRSVMKTIQEIILTVTGKEFSFDVESYPQAPTVRPVWNGVKQTFDALPDGLRSLLSWLIDPIRQMHLAYPGSPDPLREPCRLLLDEPELHLHPEWQYQVVPAFQRLLPGAQIFVATHSPFVVASVDHGWIHELSLDEHGVASVVPAKPASGGDSFTTAATDILRFQGEYSPEVDALLREFRNLRAKALAIGADEPAFTSAISMAEKLAQRGQQLEVAMDFEIRQLNKIGSKRKSA